MVTDDTLIDLAFLPQPQRAVVIDRRMRTELANSLAYLHSTLYSTINQQASGMDLQAPLEQLQQLLPVLRGEQRVSPLLFARYYQLVFAILDSRDDIAERINQLTQSSDSPSGLQIHDLSAADLGSDERVAIYRQCLDNDADIKYGYLAPEPANSQSARLTIDRALELMQNSMPALYGEIQAIISQILLAAAPKTPGAPRFDGASSYQLWGAMVLNVDDERSTVEMLETLAHECGHCLLFGLTVEEPLVLNDDSERYKSPLRTDPRPMDGIYHATFVSARMHYAMQETIKSPALTAAEREECAANLAASRKAFNDGYAVLSEFAEYSDTGREILQNAYEYMQQVAPTVAVA